MNYILLIIGFVLLVKCADIFVDGSSNLAKALKVPTLIIGLTIVAFGTSAPEAAVSVTSSLKGQNDMALGNVVGSNICNILLVLGVSALFNPLKAKKQIILKDFLFCLLSYLVLFVMVAGPFFLGENLGVLSRSDGLVLLCFLAVYLYSLILNINRNDMKRVEERKFSIKDIICIIIGIVGIILGGNLVVNSATKIAADFGVSEGLIALTVVAIGTSLPELVTSVVAAKKGETDIAIGNVIGSCIFNICFILGMSGSIKSIVIGFDSIIDILFMGLSGLIVYLFSIKNKRIGAFKGLIMIGMYILYTIYIITR